MFYLFCCGYSMMNLKGEEKWRRTPLRDIHIIMNEGQLISQEVIRYEKISMYRTLLGFIVTICTF